MNSNLIRRYVVVGSRRTSNYIWAIICAIGGIDFLLTGLSSYFNSNLLPIIQLKLQLIIQLKYMLLKQKIKVKILFLFTQKDHNHKQLQMFNLY